MTAPFDPKGVISQLTVEEKIGLLAGVDLWRTAAIPRLAVPYIKLSDGPNGARGGGGFHVSRAA
jgi:beta-glucosidase